MQVASPAGGHVGGIDEALAILRLGADDWSALEVNALYEGDRFDAWETVLTIEGPYEAFAHLETLYVGARHDHYAMQPGDGYSALVAGAQAVTTEGQGAFWGSAKMVGGAPHAL